MGNCRVSTLRGLATVGLFAAAKLHQHAFPQADEFQVYDLTVGMQHYDHVANPNYVDIYGDGGRELLSDSDDEGPLLEKEKKPTLGDEVRPPTGKPGLLQRMKAAVLNGGSRQKGKANEEKSDGESVRNYAEEFQSAFQEASVKCVDLNKVKNQDKNGSGNYFPTFEYEARNGDTNLKKTMIVIGQQRDIKHELVYLVNVDGTEYWLRWIQEKSSGAKTTMRATLYDAEEVRANGPGLNFDGVTPTENQQVNPMNPILLRNVRPQKISKYNK